MIHSKHIPKIIQAIKDYKGFKTNTELAEFLGVGKSAISNWIARQTIDEDLIRTKIPEIRLEFLRTGEYPMTEQRDIINTLMRRIDVMEKMIEKLEQELNKSNR